MTPEQFSKATKLVNTIRRVEEDISMISSDGAYFSADFRFELPDEVNDQITAIVLAELNRQLAAARKEFEEI